MWQREEKEEISRLILEMVIDALNQLKMEGVMPVGIALDDRLRVDHETETFTFSLTLSNRAETHFRGLGRVFIKRGPELVPLNLRLEFFQGGFPDLEVYWKDSHTVDTTLMVKKTPNYIM
jgi:hypothetical protein